MSQGSKKKRANLEGVGGTGGGAAAADRPEASDPITVLKELWTHSPESRARLVVFGAMVVLVVVLYHFQGNSLDVDRSFDIFTPDGPGRTATTGMGRS